MEGFEADDVIATLTTQATAAGFKVSIVTGDRDALQLVNDDVTVLYPTKGVSELTRFTPEKVQEKYGLTPAQYPDFAALRGDPSDNLPGIPGVGEKTAAKWINQFGSFAELVERARRGEGQGRRRTSASTWSPSRSTVTSRSWSATSSWTAARRTWSASPTTARPSASCWTRLEIRHLDFRGAAARRGSGSDGGRGRPRAPASTSTARCSARASWHRGSTSTARRAGPGHRRRVEARHRQSSARSPWPPHGGQAAWFDPAQLDEADEKAFAAWLADAGKPKVRPRRQGHHASLRGARLDASTASPWTRRWPPTWSSPAVAPSRWTPVRGVPGPRARPRPTPPTGSSPSACDEQAEARRPDGRRPAPSSTSARPSSERLARGRCRRAPS